MISKKRTGRWFLYCATALAAILLLTMYAPDLTKFKPSATDSNPSKTAIAAVDPPVVKVHLWLDGYPNASHAFIYAADMMGYFREQGLALEIMIPKGNVDILGEVSSGELNIALVPGPKVLFARQRLLPVVSIAAVMKGPLTYLTVPSASPIHMPRHLIGTEVGVGMHSHYEAILRTIAANDGIDPSDVTMKLMSSFTPKLMKEQQTDAWIGPNIYRDRIQYDKQGMATRMIDPTLYGVPRYYESIVAANEQAVQENPELYQKIWTALSDGQTYVEEHPDLVIRYLLSKQHSSEPLNFEVEKESFEMLLPFMRESAHPFGSQTSKVWKETAEWLVDSGMLDGDINVNDAYVKLID